MGDMADYYLDSEDWWEVLHDPADGSFRPHIAVVTHCKYCGLQTYGWMLWDGKWRLRGRQKGAPHSCKEYKRV